MKSDGVEGPSYAWAIGQEEERRISQLLDYDIRDLDFVGFNMNTVPKVCPHCGKETEIYDWCVFLSSPRPLAVRGMTIKADTVVPSQVLDCART